VIWFLSLQHQEVAKILNLKYVPSWKWRWVYETF
jgi:hypothetical protein